MLKFKENVYGFTYDSSIGNVEKVFHKPLSEEEVVLFNELLDDETCLFTSIEDCNDMFEIMCGEDLNNDEEGLSEVFDYIE
jgi:hypothetical protein